MKHARFLPALLVGLLFVPGCNMSYDEAVTLAKVGGIVCADTWVLAAKPTPDQIGSVSSVLTVVNQALANYSGTGDFADMLSVIYQEIDKLSIPDNLKPMADGLAETAVMGVDFWFSQNPDWKSKGKQSAAIAVAFVQSVQDSLPKAVKTKVYTMSRGMKAILAPPKK